MAELLIVENASSRGGRRAADRLRRRLASRLPGGEVEWTELSGLDAAALPGGRVVAVGGDGTVNAVAAWLHERGSDLPLGIVPAGTGNNLSRGIGVPRPPDHAIRIALRGSRTASVDAVVYSAGEAGARGLILQSGAIGFPARIGGEYDRLRRRPFIRVLARVLGSRVYHLLALLGLREEKRRDRRGEPPLRVTCRIEDEVIEEDILAFFIGNERSMGGEVVPCPLARTDDGRVDICLVRAGTGRSYLGLLDRVRRGRHLELEDSVVYRQTSKPVEIRLSETSPLLVDGDLGVSDTDYRLEVVPGRFRVFVGDGGEVER